MNKMARTLRAQRELLRKYFKAEKEFSSGVAEGLNNKAVNARKSRRRPSATSSDPITRRGNSGLEHPAARGFHPDSGIRR